MARLIDHVQGHQHIKSYLSNLLDKNSLPQNLLFLGPSGVGKFKMALAIAQKMVCESYGPCGKCGPCFRIQRKQSESLCCLEPDKNIIGIEQVRQMICFLQLQALGKAKVVLVRDAHCLNIQASNALLKTLEDPPQSQGLTPKTYFIFTAHHKDSLLPTLKSRFQSLMFAPLSQVELEKIVQKENISSNIPNWAFKSCQGRMDLLEKLMENSHLRKKALGLLEELFQPTVSKAFQKIKEHKNADRIQTLWIITYLSQFLRDVLLLKLGHEDLRHIDLKPSFQRLMLLSYPKLFEIFDDLLEMTWLVEGYVDRSLLFEQLILKTLPIPAQNITTQG